MRSATVTQHPRLNDSRHMHRTCMDAIDNCIIVVTIEPSHIAGLYDRVGTGADIVSVGSFLPWLRLEV